MVSFIDLYKTCVSELLGKMFLHIKIMDNKDQKISFKLPT